MAAITPPNPPPEHVIDWRDARRRMKGVIQHHLDRVSAEDLEDLASQALVDLLRAHRADGPIRNLSGLIQVIGRTTAIDEIRRRKRERARGPLQTLDPTKLPELPADEWDDRFETLWFLMLEFFRVHKSSCRDLALSYAELGDWNAVANAQGRGCDAVRKQWSRCTTLFRDELKRNSADFTG